MRRGGSAELLKLCSKPGPAFPGAKRPLVRLSIYRHVMSGLEAIGIVASISQLVQYSVKLIAILQDISQNAAHSGKRYRRHKLQVQQVIQIAEIIRATEGLQSDLIKSHLLSLAETTKSIEEAIDRTLFFAGPATKFQKCLRVLDVPKADSAVFRGFDDLERDKSCLTLCLLGSFGSLIVGIQSNVEHIPHLQGQLGDIQKSLQDCTKIAAESRRIQENTVVSSEHGFCFSCGSEQRHMYEPVSQKVCKFTHLLSGSFVKKLSLTEFQLTQHSWCSLVPLPYEQMPCPVIREGIQR